MGMSMAPAPAPMPDPAQAQGNGVRTARTRSPYSYDTTDSIVLPACIINSVELVPVATVLREDFLSCDRMMFPRYYAL